MNLTQLIKFGLENSQEPVIKNPILRAALEEPRSMAQGGRIGLQKGGLNIPFTLGPMSPEAQAKVYPGIGGEISESLTRQASRYFDQKYKVSLRGDETLDELKYLTELLEDYTKELPNIKGRYAKSAVKQAGKRASLQSIAKDYADFGKEAIDKIANEYEIDYLNSHREQRKVIKNALAHNQTASSADEARLLFDKQDEIHNTYEKLMKNYKDKTGIAPGIGEKVKLKNEAVKRIAGREKADITKKLTNFKNKEVVLIKDGNKTADVVFKDPQKQAQFLEDLEFRFKFPESGKEVGYAKKAGVLDQSALKKKYFPNWKKETIDQITAAVSKNQGWKKPTMEQFIDRQQKKLFGGKNYGLIDVNSVNQTKQIMREAGFKHYIDPRDNRLVESTSPGKSKRVAISKKLDPLNIKHDIVGIKKGSNLDTSHSIKHTLLDPDKPGPHFKAETLETLYPVRHDLNRGYLGRFPRSVLNIAEDELETIAKGRNALIDETGKIIKGKEDEFNRLQAKGTKIARNYSKSQELFEVPYKASGAPGKASGAKNIKGVLNFEVFTPGEGGALESKFVGGQPKKSYAGQILGDPLAKKPFTAYTQADRAKASKTVTNLFKDIGIRCPKGVGGNCTTPEDFKKGFNQLVKEAADGKGNKAAISKLANFTKGMRKLKGAATWTGYGL